MKIYRSLLVLSVLIFLLIVVGGAVRNLGAGLSCPDWPLCKGRLIPPMDLQVFAEYFHRLFAASVSLLTLGLSAIILTDSQLRKNLGRLVGLALLLLASQVVLGGLTVLKLLKSEIVTLHLATGTAFFATVLVMTLKTYDAQKNRVRSQSAAATRFSRLAFLATALVYLQIILGGVVSSHYAGLACPDFPTCLGRWWPGFSDPNVMVQLFHRTGAFIVFIVVSAFGVMMIKRQIKLGWLVLSALSFQIFLGIGNVLWRLPVAMSVGHLAVAECLFALLIISTYEIRHLKLR